MVEVKVNEEVVDRGVVAWECHVGLPCLSVFLCVCLSPLMIIIIIII